MCGFVGLCRGVGYPEELDARLDTALAAIRHRGPDGEGKFRTPWLLLAHARLSVIDLSNSAQQPMLHRSGRYVLVFNGEIYNYKELAAKFLADEHGLNPESDTAVLLAMYRRMGQECLQHLDGMFAFAVADLQNRTVFIARDRFGEKPIYFLQFQGMVAFASEIVALRRLLPGFPWEVDSVNQTIYHVVGSIPAPLTIYKNVFALQPARWMEFDAVGKAREGSYWSLEDTLADRATSPACNYGDAVAACQQYLLQAVRSRTVSDVPVGIFLSGGLDSSAILSLLAAQNLPVLDALCIDFTDPRFSEYRLATETARAFGARLHRHVIGPNDFIDCLDGFFAASDQPTTDGFNSYIVSKHARALGIKVWLSGVGGDELFGGYRSFRKIGRLKNISQILQLSLPSAAKDVWVRNFPHYLKFSRGLHLGTTGDPVTRAYQALRTLAPITNALAMRATRFQSSPELAKALDAVYPATDYCLDDFQRASALETSMYMASQLLRDIDNFSMAHSIETRAPFLDHKLFEFVFTLPMRFKASRNAKKPLLIDALPKRLPPPVLAHPKRGFSFPMEQWLREHMGTSFREIVLDKRNCTFWDLSAVERMWKAYVKGEMQWGVLWSYYSFARWMDAHREPL